MVALPFCHLTLKATGTNPAYPEKVGTWGERIRKRRLDLGLKREVVADLLRVSPESLTNWEKGHTEPQDRFVPAILAFLGDPPLPDPQTFGERVALSRIRLGLTKRSLAPHLHMDRTTIGKWEQGLLTPSARTAAKVAAFFGWE